ncbi:uncharacterized protein LOC126784147 [Argentina anserina]|uniref:uncharacterized protein LOC126784147 n=1 Tax=Argentina anserina TaxID=57926 RepID=UPI0021765E06|nr:uncharacterized protein LOC126784147 [Potentilla anserina]
MVYNELHIFAMSNTLSVFFFPTASQNFHIPKNQSDNILLYQLKHYIILRILIRGHAGPGAADSSPLSPPSEPVSPPPPSSDSPSSSSSSPSSPPPSSPSQSKRWIKQDLGPRGPLVLAAAYIPLTVLAVAASVLTLGGGYLFGLPMGFIADSIGATEAFLLGRTIGRSYVISKLKLYPKFQAVAVAIQRSGFKIVLLLRLAPLLPFNMLNYLVSVTHVQIGDFMLATWLGMMPITFALVYVGTTLKDLSDVTHGWNEVSTTRWVFIVLGFGISVILLICISKVAKAALEKALADNAEVEGIFSSSTLPIVAGPSPDLPKTLIIQIDS